MGDGRRIKRTITGNSIHYLLDQDGRVLDALPGIYSPAAFLRALGDAGANLTGKSRKEVQAWHGREVHSLCIEWLAAAVKAGVYDETLRTSLKNSGQAASSWRALLEQAFPASSAGIGAESLLPAESSLIDSQRIRFNPWSDAITGAEELQGPQRSNRTKIEVIREFPFPTEFDPPKGMVERPILKQTVPEVPANEAAPVKREVKPPSASGLETRSQFPYPAEFEFPKIPKSMVEAPIMKRALPGNANEALDPATPAKAGPSLAGRMTQAAWAAMAAPCRQWVHLDEASRRFMMQKLPEGIVTEEETASGQAAHAATPFGRMLERFEEAIARDMVRNEYYYHTLIHQWLEEDQEGTLTADEEALNRRVYQELFLTPDYDAWLGLVPEDTYAAIEKDGCACDKGAPPMRARK